MEGKFGMEGIPESENFTERIGTEAGSRWSDVLYKGKLTLFNQSLTLFNIDRKHQRIQQKLLDTIS